MKKKLMSLILAGIMVISGTTMSFSEGNNNISESKSLQEEFISSKDIVNTIIIDGEAFFAIKEKTSSRYGGSEYGPGGGSGKCPSKTKTLTISLTKKELIKMREQNAFQEDVQTILISKFVSIASGSLSDLISASSSSFNSISKKIKKLLDDNDVEKGAKVKITFACTDKYQGGASVYLYKISSIAMA